MRLTTMPLEAKKNPSHGDAESDEAASIITSSELTSRLHISLSCQGLANVDQGSLTDPFVVVSMRNDGGEELWSEIGRTEVVANSLDPSFVTLMPVAYRFEEVQMLRFDVYDVAGKFYTSDTSKLDLKRQKSLGSAECMLACIAGASKQIYTQDLDAPHLPKQEAKITIRAEEAFKSSDLVVFTMGASELPKGCKRVFITFRRLAEDGSSIPCFRTAVSHVTQRSCSFPEANVGLLILGNGDPYRPLLLECSSYNSSSRRKLVGSCKLSVDDMISKAGSGDGVKLSEGGGVLTMKSCELRPQHSFFDYLSGGMQLQFTVAIDYTASNGDPSLGSSLHYFGRTAGEMNQYEQAIASVGKILEFYDADRRFPVFGFGGCPIPHQPAQHQFAVNGNEHDPEVDGIDGVLHTYRQSLMWVKLSGPTLFSPIIGKVASIAASLRTSDPAQQTYLVLMILTDGVIHDMGNTKDELVAAADLPFSVIIVGVGKQNFAPMRMLDGDDVRIADSTGKKASRDIVQFVPMRDFRDKGFHALAREVLAEIPSQVVTYMRANGIDPAPRR